jgi:hypothetical protein
MYIVNRGLEIAGEYHTPGAIIENVPAEAVAWLLECGAIEQVEASEAKSAKKKGGK